MALASAGLAGAEVARVLHGTTVAANLILEARGVPTALLTKTSLKYVLETRRQHSPRRSSLFEWAKQKRSVPLAAIFETGGPHRRR
jgi:N-methylhydantoinase A